MTAIQLHLVGGFLGSGKTTAIIQACKNLMAQGKRVGVITNDQGKYLVDTAFFRYAADGKVPALEVTGGCFCCNYDDLNNRLAQLIAAAQPEVIFAESVGSCADLVATVVKPLLFLGTGNVKPSSFTAFADIRLLRLLLAGEELPFSENVNYIFEKQIEEANLLVMNKQDLLPPEKISHLLEQALQRYPDKMILAQRSLEAEGVTVWLKHLQDDQLFIQTPLVDIDYQKYGSGEAELAWLDQTIRLSGDGLRPAVINWIEALLASLAEAHAPIGHLKFIFSSRNGSQTKISFTTLHTHNWQHNIPSLSDDVEILLNGRVQMPANNFQALVTKHLLLALKDTQISIEIINEVAFHPGIPRPTHRFSN